MSEKRFTIDNTNRIFDNKNVISKTEVVVLLNQLNDENEELLKKEKHLHKVITRKDERINNLVRNKEQLEKEKGYLVEVIDKNLSKGYHEQSIKHKEAKDKKEGESSEVSPILDVIFYWTGYIKALEELKEGVSYE